MRTLTRLLLTLTVCALSATGCTDNGGDVSASPTAPAPSPSASVLSGIWTSAANGLPSPETCANFQWQVDQISGDSASGTFTATCAAGVTLSGQIAATLQGPSTADWNASGMASGSGGLSCPFSAAGTATLQSEDTLHVTYDGSTCLGPVSGEETLRR